MQWLVADQLGTPRMIVDETGALANMKRHDYLPFGEELIPPTGGRTTAMGYTSDGIRQQFTAKERDNETELDFFLARYYLSIQGRFSSPDEFPGGAAEFFGEASQANPTFYADLTNPQTLNKYQYCLNNPLRYTDPSGHQTVDTSSLTWWIASLIRTLLAQTEKYPEEPERRGTLSLDPDTVNYRASMEAGKNTQTTFDAIKQTGLDLGALQFVEDAFHERWGHAAISGALFVVNAATLGKGPGPVRESAVVIGENMMERVIPTAESLGAKYFRPLTEVTVESCSSFVSRPVNSGKRVFDVGIEWALPRSKYYAAEAKKLVNGL